LSQGKRTRIFLDSNVLTAGIISIWGWIKPSSRYAQRGFAGWFSGRPCARRSKTLLVRLGGVEYGDANRVLGRYAHLMALMKPEVAPFPGQAEVNAVRHLIRHAPDVRVLLSAIASTAAVARRTGLRIATPVEFFRALSKTLSEPPRY
jgi:hypothetical protein